MVDTWVSEYSRKRRPISSCVQTKEKVERYLLGPGTSRQKQIKHAAKFQTARVQTLQCNVENQTNVFHLCTSKVFEDRDQVEKLVIVGVREPAADGYRMLRMEYIRRGGIINYDGVTKVAADLGQVLDHG
jgi:hypothetical protein